MDRSESGDTGVRRHMGQGEKRSVSARMHQCGAKGMVGAQDVHPSNACLPLTAWEDGGSGLGGGQAGRVI